MKKEIAEDTTSEITENISNGHKIEIYKYDIEDFNYSSGNGNFMTKFNTNESQLSELEIFQNNLLFKKLKFKKDG